MSFTSGRTIRAIDLFCGAGGSSYGAKKAGVEIVAGFDIWKPALSIYRENFPDAKIFSGDIRVFSSKNIKKIKLITGKIDLILASPECTNHSKAKGAAERSEESRKTAYEVVKFARVYQPKWIVIENVVEMKNWHGYSQLIEHLRDLHYQIQEIILNSKYFGVPQSRERLFIICSLPGCKEVTQFNETLVNTVSSIIEPNGKYRFSLLRKEGRAEKTIQSAERAMAALGNDVPFLLVYYGSGRNGNGGWQNLNQPLGTITTLDRYAYVVPGEEGHMMRMLQPEELKFAMGFDLNYKIDQVEGLSRRDRIKMLGNGVCPPVMEAIVRRLISNDDN
jgi:DNA (cytosine-5)-methyltransferase 1